MPSHTSHSASPANYPAPSEATPAPETIFLLSISRDEDDAAALRADLRRSTLANYKIQHCANLDDALHLMRVCGFDLVFARLDDFQDKQACIDLIRGAGSGHAIVALATSRLLASPSFKLPSGIAATCRVEDLSPTLVAHLVQSTLAHFRQDAVRLRLEQELHLAIEAGQLGRWSLAIDSGSLELDSAAARILDLPSDVRRLTLESIVERVFQDDQPLLRRTFAQAIDNCEGLQASFRLKGDSMPLSRAEIVGQPSETGNGHSGQLFGFLKRAHPASDLYERIASANAALQRALDLRDQAVAAATQELKSLAVDLQPAGRAAPSAMPPQAAPIASPAVVPQAAPPLATTAATAPDQPEHLPNSEQPSLVLDRQAAYQNVLKSLARKQLENGGRDGASQNTFPFDFSADNKADYTAPDPRAEGFIGAAKRLVSITQKGHKIRVSLNIEDDAMAEAETQKDLIFDILRELLTNVVKHARATECIIALFRDEDDWVLQVEDDGVGLENNLVSISTPLNKIGLFRIRTKLADKGGQLDLTPVLPTGLIARARLPICLTRHGTSSHDGERA